MSYPGDPSYPGGPPPPPPPGPGGPGGAGAIEPRSGMPYAEYGTRVLAYLIDLGFIVAAYIAVFILTAIAGAISSGLGILVLLVGYLAIFALSLALFIMGDGGALGQTPGKHLMGIKVVGPAPGPIGYGQGGIRYIGRILDSIVCGLPIGLLWPLFDDQNRCWHDIIADTRVVVAPPGEKSLSYWWNNFQL